MADDKDPGKLKRDREGAPDPNAEQARRAIREVRGGEGEGRAAETVTGPGGRARPGRHEDGLRDKKDGDAT